MSADIDFLIIGAGACGLSAAIMAADLGLSTAIAEKTDRPGGNSALSTGSIPGAGTRFQDEVGIHDNPDIYYQDLMKIAGDTDDPDLVRLLSLIAAETVEWLTDQANVRLQLITDYKHVGHSVPRLHAPPSRRGSDLVDDLVRGVEERGVPLAVGNNVRKLLVERGRVCGAVIDSGDGTRTEVTAKSVLLAVNGFAGNTALVRRFCPEIADAQYFGAHGSEGEAIQWGEDLQARMDNMGAYQGYAAVADPHGSILTWTSIEKGGVLIGENGKRFGDESIGYSAFAKEVLAQGQYAYAIFDERIYQIALKEDEFAELSAHGGLKKGGTATELANTMGLNAPAVEQSLRSYNRSASNGLTDEFERTDFGMAPLEPPLYCCRVVPALFHTQGGLHVDSEARVIRNDGTPVPNLYAGGGAAAGISGRIGAAGYASGNGILSAIALGRLAAISAARGQESRANEPHS
jgi:fumarate reductase flavoprotein subunit